MTGLSTRLQNPVAEGSRSTAFSSPPNSPVSQHKQHRTEALARHINPALQNLPNSTQGVQGRLEAGAQQSEASERRFTLPPIQDRRTRLSSIRESLRRGSINQPRNASASRQLMATPTIVSATRISKRTFSGSRLSAELAQLEKHRPKKSRNLLAELVQCAGEYEKLDKQTRYLPRPERQKILTAFDKKWRPVFDAFQEMQLKHFLSENTSRSDIEENRLSKPG